MDWRMGKMETRFAEIIWANEPISSGELVKLCRQQLEWKKSTTYTMLRKLGDRGLLRNQSATVTALVGREQVRQRESQAVLERSFGGSLPAFLTAFLGGHKLTQAEAEELRQIIEEAVE